jgi:protein-S-isoprenylcysteine O-methyltransferase Ste14
MFTLPPLINAYKDSIVNLEQKIPPLIVTIFAGILMYFISAYSNASTLVLSMNFEISLIFFVIGIMFAVAGVVSFKIHKTTVNPVKTDNVSTLVKTGIYKYTRNPMYVGMFMWLVGYGIYLSNPFNILPLGLFVYYMNMFQIKPEEAFLISAFGDDYINYKQSVRRWL